jgi:hypothetical protein
MYQLDRSIKIAHPENPYAKPTSNGIVPRRKFIQQHGFIEPNSLFNEYLDRDKVRLLDRTQRAFISEKLPMNDNQPSSNLEREFLVPLGVLQQKYSRFPDIAEVPGGIIREGALQYKPTPDEEKARAQMMFTMAEVEHPFEGDGVRLKPQTTIQPVITPLNPPVVVRPPEPKKRTMDDIAKELTATIDWAKNLKKNLVKV